MLSCKVNFDKYREEAWLYTSEQMSKYNFDQSSVDLLYSQIIHLTKHDIRPLWYEDYLFVFRHMLLLGFESDVNNLISILTHIVHMQKKEFEKLVRYMFAYTSFMISRKSEKNKVEFEAMIVNVSHVFATKNFKLIDVVLDKLEKNISDYAKDQNIDKVFDRIINEG